MINKLHNQSFQWTRKKRGPLNSTFAVLKG